MITKINYELNDDQKKRLARWIKKQEATESGTLTYSLTYTGIGVALWATHNGTGRTIDLTDYREW